MQIASAYRHEKIAFATIVRKLIQNRKHMQCQGCTAIFIFKLQMFEILRKKLRI